MQPPPHCSTTQPCRSSLNTTPFTSQKFHRFTYVTGGEKKKKINKSTTPSPNGFWRCEPWRVRTLGNVCKCPGRSSLRWDHHANSSPAPKWHRLKMRKSRLISCKFPINDYPFSVALAVSDARFQGYSSARWEQMLREKRSVNIYGLKGETLEFEDLS